MNLDFQVRMSLSQYIVGIDHECMLLFTYVVLSSVGFLKRLILKVILLIQSKSII